MVQHEDLKVGQTYIWNGLTEYTETSKWEGQEIMITAIGGFYHDAILVRSF